MNTTATIRSLNWVIGLILLFSWNLQAESNAPGHPVQYSEFAKLLTPAADLPPLSGTATVGVPLSFNLPFLIPLAGTTTVTVTGLPANGLSVQSGGTSSSGPIIGGTPLTSGVMTLTLVNSQTPSGLTAFQVIILTVNPPLPPLSATATVGVPFSFNLLFLIPLAGTTTVNVLGLPANGLRVQGGGTSFSGSIIGGTPLTAGVMNLTLVNSQTPSGITAFRTITITINPPLPPLSATATVGVPFSFNLLFLIPLEGTTTVNVTGLPANGLRVQGGGLSFSGPIIGGTPLTAGVMNLTLVNSQTPSGITAFRTITITVNPPLPPISLTAAVGVPFSFNLPFLIPLDGTTTINVTGLPANGLSVQSGGISSFGPIIGGTPLTSGVMNLTLVNSQTPSGISAFRAISITVTGGALTLLAPTYDCATGAFRFNTGGGDGSAITFSAVGITGPTTSPDQFVDTELRTASDVQPLLLRATQSGVTVTFLWNIRAQCPVGPVTPPGGGLTLLAPTYDCATGAFRFNTGGGDGSAITFSAVGITGPTTSPDQFVDTGLRTANDIEPLLLRATQSGITVTYVWDLKAACGRLRLGVLEPAPRLTVVVLGNPVVGELVEIEIRGAEGQPLRVALINQQGRLVSEERIGQASAVERLSVKLSPLSGVHLLQVSTSSQTEVVRVLKTD